MAASTRACWTLVNEPFLCYSHSAQIVPTFKPHTQARYRARGSDFSRLPFHLGLEAGHTPPSHLLQLVAEEFLTGPGFCASRLPAPVVS